MISLTLPIYYVETFKTKSDKTWLVGDNAYRNWHYHLKNKVKQHYHALIKSQITTETCKEQYTLCIQIYLKNINSDGSNVASRIEKFALDGLQEVGVITNDNSKYHLGTTWSLKGIDKENPRAEVTVVKVSAL